MPLIKGLIFNSKSIQTPLHRTYWIVPLILIGRDDTEPSLNKADAILSVTQNTLQWIRRHPELHSCHFQALQPSGRPAISYSKCKVLRLALKETSISNCVCKVWAPQKNRSGLCLEQTWRWSLPKAKTSMEGNTLGNTLKLQFGLSIPCIMKVLNKTRKYLFCFSVAFPPTSIYSTCHAKWTSRLVSAQKGAPWELCLGALCQQGMLSTHAPGTGSALHPSLAYRLLDSVLRSSWGGCASSPPLEKGRLPWQRPLRERGVGWKIVCEKPRGKNTDLNSAFATISQHKVTGI